MQNLDAIIKAYDVRGTVPDQLSPELVREIGIAFVTCLEITPSQGGPGAVVVGRDMRSSGPELVAAFAAGVQSQGCDVIDIGLCSTDGLYFASGRLGLPAAMFTASHNPAQYNGIKLCRAGAAPVSEQTGLAEIKAMVANGVFPEAADEAGTLRERDMLHDYASFLRSMVDISDIQALRVVVDAGNGMAGFTAPAVLGGESDLPPAPITLLPMYFELDGTFPNHEANPIDPENLRDLQDRVRKVGADVGLAFDGDADRCFVVDENGDLVSPSAITAMIAASMLSADPGATVIHNLITSRAVPEIILENGGLPVRTRVGHSFIKATMAEQGAMFGGEHSGHFYFRDFWFADSGMLAALHVLALLGRSEGTMSELVDQYDRYSSSGEINSTVDDVPAAIERVRQRFEDEAEVDELDGLTFTGGDWWFNVRPSNTEPLLRLNAEARDSEELNQITERVLSVIREKTDG